MARFYWNIDESKRFILKRYCSTINWLYLVLKGNGLEGIEKFIILNLKFKPVKSRSYEDAKGRLVMSVPNDASKPEQKHQI